jgi:hypothetical protein
MAKEKVKEKVKEKRGGNEEGGLHWFVKRMVAVFATFFVVIGVAIIGLLARDTMPELVEEIVYDATSTTVYAPAFLIVDDSSAYLHKIDGEYLKDFVWPDDTKILDKPVSQLKGVWISSGEPAWLTNEFEIATTTKYRSPDGRREAKIGDKRRDGSTPLIISYGNDDDVRVLRYSGDLIKSVELIGWMGDKVFILSGEATGTKAFFALDLGGGMNYIANAPDVSWGYRVTGDAVYFLSSEISLEDKKEAKIAPGSLNKVSLNGKISELISKDDSVIQAYVLSEDMIDYALVNQNMFQKTGGSEIILGKCLPLMFLDDGQVLCRAGDGVEIRKDGIEPKRVFAVSDAVVFYLDKVRMDEPAQIQ